MGVPKFYRWISERYPCLSEVVKDYQIPEFDNLYLDMNGVVHTCSHPEDDNPHFRITEEKIMEDIFHYIEVLYRMIKPKKVFFMAIDGVAPRAKMNQQRGRRFRSAREAENLVKKALEKGEVLPTEARFDSNCITPGTEFMDKLQEQLQYFVVKKVSTDRLWQGVRIFLSGHETPGEGEHKVMDFIRYEKSQPGYDSNTRHCLYGLDADLIMLGLSTHEPHFSLLREEVRFGKQNQKRSTAPEETTFHLLHLALMREYLDFEFSSLKGKLPFGYDLERIIDDWILMGFLVGNDFIPPLPDLHIHHDALPVLWNNYRKVLPSLNGYLSDAGLLNLVNFEKYLRVLSKVDYDKFSEKHADIKWLESRKESRDARKHHALTSDETGIPTAKEFMTQRQGESTTQKEEYDTMLAEYDFSDEEQDSDEEQTTFDEQFFTDFSNFKASYYSSKMKFTDVNQDVLRDQATGYIRAIQWILFYYFDGVPSWSWYYPHHYAPYLSDVRNFNDMRMEFDFSKPFLPFQQLMAVLPAASKNLMPVPLQSLMLSDSSPVIDYYPVDFETDLNGKQQEWEAVVLIPFIDENRLISAMRPIEAKLTDEEKGRNKHGPHILFQYTPDIQGTFTSSLFPDIVNHHAKITNIIKDLFWMMDKSKLKKGLCPGVKLSVYFPGFPTMKHIPHTANLQKCGVKVFQHTSRGENMMLTITKRNNQTLEELARSLIGQSTYVAWPHLCEARVSAVCDGVSKCYWANKYNKAKSPASYKDQVVIESDKITEDEVAIWRKEVSAIHEEYRNRKGVFLGQTEVLVYANALAGRRYMCGPNAEVVLEKQWSSASHAYVLQGTIKDISVQDQTFTQYRTLDALFSEKSEVFMLGQPQYGCMGEVLSVDAANEGRVRVDFIVLQEPDLVRIQNLRERISTRYFPGYSLARRLGLSTIILSRITGCVFISKKSEDEKPDQGRGGRVNIGLNLKMNKTGQEVPGYTRKLQEEWQYSEALEHVLQEYVSTFPELFETLARNSNEASYYADQIFEGNSGKKLPELTKFIKELPCSNVPPVPHGSEVLDGQVIKEIEKEVEKAQAVNRRKKKHIKMQVRPHLLFRPLEAQVNLLPDPSTTYGLFDRIINVRDGYSVPLGLRGTVVGITNAAKERDVLYDVLFDEPFLGGLTLRCSPNQGYRMPMTAMINLSHGERKALGIVSPQAKPTAVVKPQSSYAGVASPRRGGGHIQDRPRDNYQGNRQDQFNNYQGNRPQPQPGQQYRQQQPYNQQQQQQYGNQQQQWQRHGGSQQPPNQGRPGIQKRQEAQPQSQDEFTDLWKQLEHAQLTDPTGQSAQPLVKKPDKDSQSKTVKKNNSGGPSLQQAANVLKTLSLQTTEMPTDAKPGKHKSQKKVPAVSQKVDVETLLTFGGEFVNSDLQKGSGSKKDSTQGAVKQHLGNDEFSSILHSLQDGQDPPGHHQPDVGEGTAMLCQMLNINPESSSTQEVKGHGEKSNQQNLGRQMSVQELFDVVNQESMKQDQQGKLSSKSKVTKSAVDELKEWCASMAIPGPTYDYQPGRDNKQRAVVALPDGQEFHGSFARGEEQAAESAAGMAMLHLTTTHGDPLGQSFTQHEPHHQGPRHLSTSPNSAFTAVRPPVRAPPQAMPMAFQAWGPHGAPPFPPPPMFGPRSHGPSFHQQHFPPHHQMHGNGPRSQYMPHRPGFFPPQNMDQPPPFGFPPAQWGPMDQNGPRNQSIFTPQQHSFLQQQGRGQGQMVNQRGQGYKNQGSRQSQEANQHQVLNQSQSDSEPDNVMNKADTPEKGTRFVPLQVMQKQKTPQRESKKDSSEEQITSDTEFSQQTQPAVSRVLDLNPGEALLQVLTNSGASTISTEGTPLQSIVVPPGSEKNKSQKSDKPLHPIANPQQTSSKVPNLCPAEVNDGENTTDTNKFSDTYKTPTKGKGEKESSVTPGRKGRSRLAANFSAMK